MIEILYFISIYPLEQLLGFLLNVLYTAIGNYGLSIIVLSLLLNLALLKIILYTDKKAKEESELKAKLDKRIKNWKSVYKRAKLYGLTHTLYAQNAYHPIYALRGLGGLALQIPFFWAMYLVIKDASFLQNVAFGYIADLSKPDSIGGIHLLPIIMSVFTLINVFIISKDKSAILQGSAITLIFLVLLYNMPSALVLYWTSNMFFALLKSIIVKFIESKKIESKSTKSKATKPQHFLETKSYSIYRDISIFAILNLCFMVCVFSPYAVYSSDVSQFDSLQTYPTLAILFGIFLLASFLSIYFTSFFYHSGLLKLGVFALLVLFLIAISYTFIFTGNIFNGRAYAELDGLLFRDGGANISSVWAKYFDISYGVFLMLVAFLILRFLKQFVRFALAGFFALLVLSSLIDLGKIIYDNKSILKTTHKAQNTESKQALIPDYVEPYLNFSKEKNILVLFSDAVQSDNFTQILKDYPELYESFEGFTYYTNALSVANITFASAPAISGGVYYHPNNINKRKLSHPLYVEGSKAVVGVANSFSNAGYKVSLGTAYPGEESILLKNLNKDIFLVPKSEYSAWVDLYKQHYNIKDLDSKDSMPIGDLFSIGLFRAAPYIFRSRIYLAQGWIFGNSLLYNHYKYATTNASRLPSFALVSKASEKKPTFKFIYEATEHFPWLLDKDNDCKPIDSDFKYRTKSISAKDELAYSNHICYVRNLTKWLQWFKDSKIYDKTKIIIVSDHGNGGVGAPLIDFPRRELRNAHILLLVKDFNAKGKLKIDTKTFVSNSDAIAIACDEIDSTCPNIAPSILKREIPNRELIFSLVDGGTGREKNSQYDIVMSYKVKNSIFNLSNWSDITKEVLGKKTQSQIESNNTQIDSTQKQ